MIKRVCSAQARYGEFLVFMALPWCAWFIMEALRDSSLQSSSANLRRTTLSANLCLQAALCVHVTSALMSVDAIML